MTSVKYYRLYHDTEKQHQTATSINWKYMIHIQNRCHQ